MANAIHTFKSIGEFEKYINETPLNNVFRWTELASSRTGKGSFNKTHDFAEALDLLKYGWEDMAKKIEANLKLIASEVTPGTKQRAEYSVAGFQASVPRYLQGLPTSMINKKSVPVKQKVITIVKHIGYSGDTLPETIMENSLKALQIVKKIEAQGYRVNLDILSPVESSGGEIAVCRVRVKSAAERMNIAKVAFPLVHPDMLRRMIFRFREVTPELKDRQWTSYGRTIQDPREVKKYMADGEYYLSNFIDDVDDEIKKMALR